MDLEAQLDHLLNDLEEVEPDAVPVDLRKNKPPETPQPPEAAEPEPAPIDAEADAQTAEPAAAAEDAAAAEAPAEQGLSADTIAAMASDLLDSQIDSTIEAASVDAAPEEPAAAPEAPEVSQTVQHEPEPVPVDAGPEPEPIKPLSEDELASQLDSLLTQVQNPTAVPTEPGAGSPVSESTEAQEAAAEAVTESQTPEPAQSLSEDDLASQLDSLLTQVQNPTAAAEAASTDEPTAGAAEADIDSAEPAEVVASTDAAIEDEDAGAVSIDQIDAMLAETAEQAIEHGPAPETDIPPGTDEVLAAQAKAEEEAEARAQADRDAAEPVPVPAEAASAPEPEPVPVPVPVEASEPEPVAVEPQPVPVEAGAVAAGGASAADVANELDNDAQASGQPDNGLTEAAFAEPFQGEDGHEAFDDGQVHVNHSGLKKAEFALLMICSKVNKPLNRLSPEMRDSVGYAGLATTGLAFFMLIYGVLF